MRTYSRNEFVARDAARKKAWDTLVTDARYLRLEKRHQEAIRAELAAEHDQRVSRHLSPETQARLADAVRRAKDRHTRAARARQKFEDAYIKARGG